MEGGQHIMADSKIPFLAFIYIAEELKKSGFLKQDPANKDNILVYRKAGDENHPEGWYSENLLSTLGETFHSKRGRDDFLTTAAKCGIDVNAQITEARKTLY